MISAVHHEVLIIHPRKTRLLAQKRPFYGWAVAVVALIAAFASGPGQSYVFSVFVDSILADTGVSRTQLSALYAIGTGVSAITALVVSRLVDRFGSRVMLAVIALAFGGACFGMAGAIGALTLLFGFAALRALGQGSLPITATLLTAQWFARYRGRAMAFVSMGFALSNALFPPIAQFLIASLGWRNAYRALGVGVWLLIIPAALLVVRNRPEVLGLHPDGLPAPPDGAHDRPIQTHAAALQAAWRTRRFWLLALPLTASPFIITALVFHQVSIFAERGLSPDVAAGVFVAFAAAAAVMTVLIGFLIERVEPRTILFANLALLLIAMLELQVVTTPVAAVLYTLTLGSVAGTQSVIGGVIWAHYYGRIGLGAVQGTAATVTISAAAQGPLPLATLQELTGAYTVGLLVLAALPILCAGVLAFFRPSTALAW
jgi:MFS family permease